MTMVTTTLVEVVEVEQRLPGQLCHFVVNEEENVKDNCDYSNDDEVLKLTLVVFQPTRADMQVKKDSVSCKKLFALLYSKEIQS